LLTYSHIFTAHVPTAISQHPVKSLTAAFDSLTSFPYWERYVGEFDDDFCWCLH